VPSILCLPSFESVSASSKAGRLAQNPSYRLLFQRWTRRCPGGGLAFGALHEVAGGAGGTVDGAAAALFVAGIAARTKGRVLWCMTRQDLFFPAVSQVHVHAMIAARDDVGEALRLTKPELYEWRERFAAKAREQGIAMVATRRADVAATRPYSQGRPVPMSAARPILVISRRRP
jgi:hypothetical protein